MNNIHMEPQAIPAEASKILMVLRSEAQLKQNQVAQQAGLDPSRLSRFEKGDITFTRAEFDRCLVAVKTSQADEYREFLDSVWSELPKPSFLHPNRSALRTAEQALQRVRKALQDAALPDTLRSQLEMHEAAVRRGAEYLSSTEHGFAFVGEIGVGKSTALCVLNELLAGDSSIELRKRLALETGVGRTTVCEVHIIKGKQFGILIEPQSEDEIFAMVCDLCEVSSGQGYVGGGVPKEIDRALRNMAGLGQGKSSEHDPLKKLATEMRDERQLRAEFLRRLNLTQRVRTEIWHDAARSVNGFEWLRSTFREINNGRRADVSLPKRVTVLVPQPILGDAGYELRVIDTKGIDGTAIRPDLKACLDDGRIVTILCSKFGSAPDTNLQLLLKHAQETGLGTVLADRVVVLLLPRGDESIEMKYDSGDCAENAQEGYALKAQQVRQALLPIHAENIPLACFDSMVDDPSAIRGFLLNRIQRLRHAQVLRTEETAQAIDALIQSFERKQDFKALEEVLRRIGRFLSRHEQLPPSDVRLYDQLLSAIRTQNAQTVRATATVRRKGSWPNLDIYYYLGAAAASDCQSRSARAVEGLEEILADMLQDDKLRPAHDFVRELKSNVEYWRKNFLGMAEGLGKTSLKPALAGTADLWQQCEERFGQRRPRYRDDIADYFATWFKGQKSEFDTLEARLQAVWQTDFLRSLKQLIEPVASSVGAA